MEKNYNKDKHFQLLKYSEDLRKQGKFIGMESREDYLKLLNYSSRNICKICIASVSTIGF